MEIRQFFQAWWTPTFTSMNPEERNGKAFARQRERRLFARGAQRLNAIVVDGEAGASDFWGASGYQAQSHRLRFVKNTRGKGTPDGSGHPMNA